MLLYAAHDLLPCLLLWHVPSWFLTDNLPDLCRDSCMVFVLFLCCAAAYDKLVKHALHWFQVPAQWFQVSTTGI